MSDTFQKVRAGNPLVIPAVTYNTPACQPVRRSLGEGRFVDAARDYLARQQDQAQSSRPGAQHSGIVVVRNDSGSARIRARSEYPIAVDARVCPP